jgi:hypothetical protein
MGNDPDKFPDGKPHQTNDFTDPHSDSAAVVAVVVVVLVVVH